MGQVLFKKIIRGVKVEVRVDDTKYSPEEERKLMAQFIYILTSDGAKETENK